MPWVSLLFEGVMATLMVALIIYCVKLDRRLTLLRNQDTQMAEMIAGFRDASDRAEQSAQRLKAAGLAAERSLRAAMLEAEAMRSEFSMPASVSAPVRPEASPDPASVVDLMNNDSGPSIGTQAPKRDMLMPDQNVAPDTSKRAETREEAEQAVLEAIRSARTGTA